MNTNLVCMCFILVSLQLRVLCCCRLSRVSGMVIRCHSRIACGKINSADSDPRAYSSDSPMDKATVPCPRHSLVRKETLINVTQGARCALPRHRVTSPVCIRISRDVFQSLAQVVRFRCRYRQREIQFTCSFHISQRFLGTCQICKCW